MLLAQLGQSPNRPPLVPQSFGTRGGDRASARWRDAGTASWECGEAAICNLIPAPHRGASDLQVARLNSQEAVPAALSPPVPTLGRPTTRSPPQPRASTPAPP